jgi:hypothetical protein
MGLALAASTSARSMNRSCWHCALMAVVRSAASSPRVDLPTYPVSITSFKPGKASFLKGAKNRYNLLFAEWFGSVIITYVART